MTLSSTANDDQPGPIGRRHSSTGADLVQSVWIVRPRITLSRFGPRNPGHSTRRNPCSLVASPLESLVALGSAALSVSLLASTGVLGFSTFVAAGAAVTDGGAGAAASGAGRTETSSRPCARSRSSGDNVHRHWKWV